MILSRRLDFSYFSTTDKTVQGGCNCKANFSARLLGESVLQGCRGDTVSVQLYLMSCDDPYLLCNITPFFFLFLIILIIGVLMNRTTL